MDVITTHLHADCDGLAAMVAARKLYPGAVLVLPGGAQETVRHFLALHDLGLTRLKDLQLAEVTRLILVDTQEPERLGPLQPLCANPAVAIHIFDHHPAAEGKASQETCEAERKIVEPVGATTTVLIERVLQQGLAFSPLEATTLALGLYDETGSFTYVSTTPRDLQAAAAVLRAGADLTVVADVLRQPLEPDTIALLNDLLQHSTTYYLEGCTVLLATSTDDRYGGELADVVHRLAELKGLDAVIVAFAMDDKIEIIGRSRRPRLDVAQIVAEFGGGGHAGAAAATVKDRTLVEVRERLAHLLTTHYHPTLRARDVMTTPVHTITEDATIAETAHRMTTYGVTVLPVVDGQAHYCGMTTREIVQQALVQSGANAPLRTCLQTELYTATPETTFGEIARQMTARRQRAVPILTGVPPAQQVVGIITRADLLRAVHEEDLAAARLRATGQPFPAAPPATASAEGFRAAFSASARHQFNGAPFPATASAEGAQLNASPSLHWPGHTAQPERTGARPRAALEPWLVRFVALVEALPDVVVHEVLQRLSLSRRHRDTVHAARAARHAIPRLAARPPLQPAETYRLLAGQRLETVLFVLAKTSSAVAQQQIVAYLDTYRAMKPRLSGDDLQAMGLTPGPRLHQVLDRLLEARLNGEVTTDMEERALVQQLLRTGFTPSAQPAGGHATRADRRPEGAGL